MEAIIDTRIKKAMTLHDILHVFGTGRLMGTAIIELNPAQEMASVDQDPLLLLFLELRKSYDNMDCGRLLKTFEGYEARPKMWGILAEFWA